MDAFKKLKQKSIQKTIPLFLLFLAIAVVVCAVGGAYNLPKMLFPKTLSELTPETMEGAYVKDDIYYIYSGFAYESETKNGKDLGETRVWYITDFDEEYYMSMSVGKKDIAYADALMEEYWDYLDYGIVPENEDWMILPISGTITALDSELSYYYYEDVSAETQAIMLPYSLDAGMLGSQTVTTATVCGVVSLVLAAIAVYFMAKAATGGYQKDAMKELNNMGSRDIMVERLNGFYQATPAVQGVRIDKEFVLIQSGPNTYLHRPQDIAWVYQTITQHRTNGIPSGKSYSINIMLMDGKNRTLALSKKAAEELLVYMESELPGAIVGYTDEIAAQYANNRAAFAHRWEMALGQAQTATPEPQAVPQTPIY